MPAPPAPLDPPIAPVAEPPRIGLLASAVLPTIPADVRWEEGFRFDPEDCASGDVIDICDNDTTKEFAGPRPVIQYTPFGIWDGFKCSTFQWNLRGNGEGGFGARNQRAKAERALLACESRLIATEFYSGSIARAQSYANRYLTHIDGLVLTAGAVSPLDAMTCLEQALGDCACGARGMIHATRGAVTQWDTLNLLRTDGGLVLTRNDTIVVADAGYDGSGPQSIPDGAPIPAEDGAVWAYATGRIRVLRSPIKVYPPEGQSPQGVNRESNTIEVLAERAAAAFWDNCCHFAVRIDMPLCVTSGIGS